jgi:hypothetical protein
MLADLLVREGKVEQAVAEYQEVLKADPAHQRARLGLQNAREKQSVPK